jgi:hypothetical protein
MVKKKRTKEFKLAELSLDEWENVEGYTLAGDSNDSDMPKNRLPVFARIGMLVDFMDDGGGSCAQIIAMTPEICIARTQGGSEVPFSWSEVSLTNVMPDPKQVTGG